MKTKISHGNPHGFNRYAFAWEHSLAGGRAHLDFGCFNGDFLASMANKGIVRLVGVDVSSEAVAAGRQKHPGMEILHVPQGQPLPFADGTFSSISLLDVIEHVHDQKALLDELARVLADDGTLVVTVPGRHLFSFLDTGNFKFRFPRLHRWYYCRRHSRQEYERRYAANADGLVGDVSAQKRWHQHFGRRELAALLAGSGLAVRTFDGTGFFSRLVGVVGMGFGWLGPMRRMFAWLGRKDARAFNRTNLYCAAGKAGPASAAPTGGSVGGRNGSNP